MFIEVFLITIFSLLLIFFLPGCILFNVFIRETLNDLDFFEVLFLMILGSILISGWIGLTLAEFGYFSLVNILIILLVFCGILCLKYKVKFNLRSFPHIELKNSAILIILFISIAFFFHPFEWIAGGGDPGLYVNSGINIVNTGSITIYSDPTFTDIPDSMVIDFYRELLKLRPFAGLKFDETSGNIYPQFYHLFPAWIAIFYSIFGLKNSLFVTPLFGLLGTVSVYLTGKRFFNDKVGLIAAGLLSLSLPQIWYSRYPTTEVMTQFLIFSGLFTFVLYKRTSNPYLGVLSALSFGEMFLTRIDSLIILLFIVPIVIYLRLVNKIKKQHLFFIVPFLIIFIHSFIHAITISKHYTFNTIQEIAGTQSSSLVEFVYEIGVYKLISAAIIIIGIIVFLDIYKKNIIYDMNKPKFFFITKLIRYCFSIIVIIIFIYLYFIRPLNISEEVRNMGMSYNELNLIRLGWYISSLGILLGAIGYVYMIYRKPYFETYIFLMVALSFSFILLYNALINPLLHWWVRRFVPVVLPAFFIAIGFSIDKIKDMKYGKKIAILLLLILVIYSINIDMKILNHTEFKGFIDQTTVYAKDYDENDILIFDGGTSGNIMPLPLKYIYRKNVINLRHEDPRLRQNYMNYSLIESMIDYWMKNEKKVYLINPQTDTSYNLNRSFIIARSSVIEFPLLEQTHLSLPEKINSISIPINVYKIEPASNIKSDTLIIDVGSDDVGYLNKFHDIESHGNITFRWTQEISYIRFTSPGGNNLILLELNVNGWRPVNVPLPNISLMINSHFLANFSASANWDTYRFTIPEEFLNRERSVIEIRSDTFVPAENMNASDNRKIGVMIDKISFTKID